MYNYSSHKYKKIVNAVYRLIFLNVEFILGKKDEKIPVIEAINKS